MSFSDKVIESKLDLEYYFGEEGAEPLENAEDADALQVIDGNHVVPPGVAVEEHLHVLGLEAPSHFWRRQS